MADTRVAGMDRGSGKRPDTDSPVVVVGGGPAGLATAYELARRRIPYRVLERGDSAGYVWRNLYDSLTLHTGRHLSALPGAPFPRGTPLFPRRTDFVAYLDSYRTRFNLDVETGVDVLEAKPSDGLWRIETSQGQIEAAVVVAATGIVSSPVVPSFPGRDDFPGNVIHSVEYRRPHPFDGRKVLVVGCGNSGGEIATELAAAGVDVTVAVRTGANVVPLTIAGIPIQYIAVMMQRLPAPAKKMVVAAIRSVVTLRRGPPVLPVPPYGPLDHIPLIGFHFADAVRAGKVRIAPGIERFTVSGVRFTDGAAADFDDVILATGFRHALGFLNGVIRTDAEGQAIRSDRVTSADAGALYFVGHNYDTAGGLRNIARDAGVVADRILAT